MQKGDIFVHQHSFRAPDVYQVVDFTKTGKSVRMREIKVDSTYNSFGGTHVMNKEWLKENPVELAKWDYTFRIGTDQGSPYLVHKGEYFFRDNDFDSCTSCEY